MTVESLPSPASVGGASPGRSLAAYQIFMLTLCVLALATLVVQIAFQLDPEVERVLVVADTAICVVFAFDFLVTFVRAPNKMRYMMTWGWLDLISSIPTLDVARWGRLARVARLLRVLRVLRAARVLSTVILKERAESTVLAAALLAFMLIFGASVAILQFESSPQSNIIDAEDAVWWAFTTITTVGYGDRFPVTLAGRVTGGILMTAGVGLFGAFAAGLAAWFISPQEEQARTEQARTDDAESLGKELAALREAVEASRTAPPGP